MKITDQTYHCQIPGHVFGPWKLQCHLCIFQPHSEVQTVMVTDMSFEIGWFIPSLIEKLMESVIRDFQLDPAKLVWIERYTPASRPMSAAGFSQVTFDWQDGQATNLQWKSIATETIQVLISDALLPA